MDDDLLHELHTMFAVEARERLHALSVDLLALERGPGSHEHAQILSNIFRAAHSLKGAARVVGAKDIEEIAHSLETLFERMRSGELDPDPSAFDRLHRAFDAMNALVGAFTTGEHEPVEVAGIVNDLAALATDAADDEAARERGAEGSHAPRPDPVDRGSSGVRFAGETIRVATSKLDSLVAQVGEMFVADEQAQQLRANLAALCRDVNAWETASRKERLEGRPHVELRTIRERLGQLNHTWAVAERRRRLLTREFQAGVRHLRLLPISTVLDAFPRMIRDLARDQEKEIDFVVNGSDTEVDRSVLEQIKDPLTHLLRNCVDHGIERPERRLAAGKPSLGTITVSATQRGDRLVVEVADDGVGIDPDRIRAVAAARGLLTETEAASLHDRDASWMIFASGLSTSPSVTDISGRGVGLDVVHDAVDRLHGTIELDSRLGAGSTFRLILPMEVAATRCLLVRVGDQAYALPTTSVVRIIRLHRDDIGRAGGREAVEHGGEPIVVASLEELIDIERTQRTASDVVPAVVIGPAGRRIAVVVDALVGEQDAVVKSLPAPFVRVSGAAGATILGTGEVVIVLSIPDLLVAAGRKQPEPPPPRSQQPAKAPTLLVVDDSITTRTLEKNILEAAGYRVTLAGDGAAAWARLKNEDVDLLISDVMMPGINGFDLTAKVRADEQLKTLPVVLVTSLASTEHREHGVDVGADAYIVKGEFDQDRLLETVRRLL